MRVVTLITPLTRVRTLNIKANHLAGGSSVLTSCVGRKGERKTATNKLGCFLLANRVALMGNIGRLVHRRHTFARPTEGVMKEFFVSY